MLRAVRSYLRDKHLEGKTWLYYAFCCCPQYQHNRRHPDTDMAFLRLLLPVSSILLILSLRLVKFPHRYIHIWNPIYVFYTHIDHISKVSATQAFWGPWPFLPTFGQLKLDHAGPQVGHLDIPRTCLFFTDARIVCSERQNSQIKENWQGLGVL